MTISATHAHSSQDLHATLDAQDRGAKPSFFRLEAQLPREGRTNIPLAANQSMSIVLKTYASGGENELHAHRFEDHTFVVLQGAAKFYGPQGEERVISLNEGVLLPRGAFYWFHVTSEEPLVMLRIGAGTGEGDRYDRIDIDGATMGGDDPKNKKGPLELTDVWYGRA